MVLVGNVLKPQWFGWKSIETHIPKATRGGAFGEQLKIKNNKKNKKIKISLNL